MRINLNKLIGIEIIVLSIFLASSFAANSEPNNLQEPNTYIQSTISGESEQTSRINILRQRLDILLGFGLGLFSTSFMDYIRKKRKTKEFREGMRTELKQALAVLNLLPLNHDSKITVDKVRSWQKLSKEFDLRKETSPLEDDPMYNKFLKKDLDEKDLNEFVALHSARKIEREQGYNYQFMKKINCNFIQNNISSISLLNKPEQSLFLNILRRLDAINEQISHLNFFFEKTYDATVEYENRERLKMNYLSGCQFISDWSYEAAKEIAHLLRQ